MTIHAYLTFSGNCREALFFYQKCLGGELSFQKIGESPLEGQLPEQMKESILHGTLTNEKLVLMASDMVPDSGLQRGNSVSLMLDCDSEEAIRKTYTSLSDGGRQDHPIETTFWGALFGDLTDRFGNHWILHYQIKNES